MRSISDHYVKAYLNVIRGMNLRARLASSHQVLTEVLTGPASPTAPIVMDPRR
ncbi:hypothetical protein GUITHDRAFT_153632 [Guillardia theta CCMP2712]|uniref:Uncharacterized protein n=1 Tax=Guillardia theta (strain CCMP2712) TaxID=905079 RepID=L1J298_GUITC|nr:hypothetical protein GUITHDRAFT_153632 [Guillardia theta CCMP2712]EKX42254.1 hypothetical protein GUITHDRAFT_153632 [Guillardia theta CCMP2712]|eukprot:XP_005829234.1 hypothetical protein GUITHDRAFT_153632 [Guillardia theta CCMP2712]